MACSLLVYFRFRVTMFIHIVYFVSLLLYNMKCLKLVCKNSYIKILMRSLSFFSYILYSCSYI